MNADEVAARAERAARALGGTADPAMTRWAQELVAAGWVLEASGGGYLKLAWPKVLAAVTWQPLGLYVPVVRQAPDFAELSAAMYAALGAVCQLSAAIRQAEQRVHEAAVGGGWERDRPVRWPSTEAFWPSA